MGTQAAAKNAFIPQALRVAYRPEALLSVNVRQNGGGSVSVDLLFPKYDRSAEEMDHVSAVQLTAAMIEAGVCALEDAFLSNMFPAKLESDWFYSTLGKWLLLRSNTLYRSQVVAEKPSTLNFRVLDIGVQRLRRRVLSATMEFDGFCSGETVWVIDPPRGLIL